jgi:hypothetical protein
MVPWLANRLLGIDNLFGFSGWWIANTTFLASTAVIAWLAVDPVSKAFFTLRVFYGQARRNGEDLRVELRLAQHGRPLKVAAIIALTLICARAFPTPVWAAESAIPVRMIEPGRLNGAIDHVLAGSDFQWRLRPMPRTGVVFESEKDGPVKRFLRAAVEAVQNFFEWLQAVWHKIRDWFTGVFPSRTAPDTHTETAAGMVALEVLLWVFVVVVAGLLIGVVVLAWRRRRLFKNPVLAAQAVTAAAADLQDENTQAAQLPAEGWLSLAREQLGRGEWRLAWRALYLATLARLAAQGLVSLAKFKTNLDYERELRRRAITRQEVVAWFSSRRGAFEAVWYGRALAGEKFAREWLAELERPSFQ